jgi:hypothetical protein
MQMNLNCPKCGAEQTRKLSMVMSEGGLREKGAQFGAVYLYNIWIPVATVIGAIAFGIVFAMMNGFLGLLAFAGILVAGFYVRKTVKAKTRPKFADLPIHVKQDGFQCNRCEHVFLPTAS